MDHVSLDVPARALKSIIGPNGAGQDHALQPPLGPVPRLRGEDRLQGRGRHGLERGPPDPRRDRALVPADQHLPDTLRARERPRRAPGAGAGSSSTPGGATAPIPALEDRAWEILETVLLGAKWRAPAGELAHGEKRKLEVGILLALDAEVLLLDEPTAGMSLEEVPSIIALIEGIRRRRDRTVLLVEHKIDMIMALSDSIAVLKDGRLIADDTPEAISRNAEVQAAYFGGGGGVR